MKPELEFHHFPGHVGLGVSAQWNGIWETPRNTADGRARYLWFCIMFLSWQVSLRLTLKRYGNLRSVG